MNNIIFNILWGFFPDYCFISLMMWTLSLLDTLFCDMSKYNPRWLFSLRHCTGCHGSLLLLQLCCCFDTSRPVLLLYSWCPVHVYIFHIDNEWSCQAPATTVTSVCLPSINWHLGLHMNSILPEDTFCEAWYADNLSISNSIQQEDKLPWLSLNIILFGTISFSHCKQYIKSQGFRQSDRKLFFLYFGSMQSCLLPLLTCKEAIYKLCLRPDNKYSELFFIICCHSCWYILICRNMLLR